MCLLYLISITTTKPKYKVEHNLYINQKKHTEYFSF